MIEWLNANTRTVQTITSLVTAFTAIELMCTTIVYVIYTWQLAVENRLLRKASTDPRVVGYATINPRVFGAIEFVIRNVGKGPARNVSYKIVSGGDDLNMKGVRLLPSGVAFAFLPQDEQLSAPMGMGWDLLKQPCIAPFEIELSYSDLTGQPHSERFKIDVGQFAGLSRLGKPSDEETAEAIKKIANIMDSWSMRRLQVETMSVTERHERDEQNRAYMEEQRSQSRD